MCATNMSPNSKTTLHKRSLRLTIYSYIQELKLQKANKLLTTIRELSIGEIASRVGYKHQGYFSQLFFQKYGIYPKELLKFGV